MALSDGLLLALRVRNTLVLIWVGCLMISIKSGLRSSCSEAILCYQAALLQTKQTAQCISGFEARYAIL